MLITHIGQLAGIVPPGVLRKQGAEMSQTGILHDAWLRIEDGVIAGFGRMEEIPGQARNDYGGQARNDYGGQARMFS